MKNFVHWTVLCRPILFVFIFKDFFFNFRGPGKTFVLEKSYNFFLSKSVGTLLATLTYIYARPIMSLEICKLGGKEPCT